MGMVYRTMQGEQPDLPEPENADAAVEIMGVYDAVDGVPTFVIADVTRDEAWLSMPAAASLDIDDWQ